MVRERFSKTIQGKTIFNSFLFLLASQLQATAPCIFFKYLSFLLNTDFFCEEQETEDDCSCINLSKGLLEPGNLFHNIWTCYFSPHKYIPFSPVSEDVSFPFSLVTKCISALYAHLARLDWGIDINRPEQFGFATGQVKAFNLSTPDGETLYAWHVLPLGLYAKHEAEILQQKHGLGEDITTTIGFRLLADPEARLIINFHGNAGTVAQGRQHLRGSISRLVDSWVETLFQEENTYRVFPLESVSNPYESIPLPLKTYKKNTHSLFFAGWRTDTYRALSDGSTSNLHILTIDYRGFGFSTGSPTENGLITDGVAVSYIYSHLYIGGLTYRIFRLSTGLYKSPNYHHTR